MDDGHSASSNTVIRRAESCCPVLREAALSYSEGDDASSACDKHPFIRVLIFLNRELIYLLLQIVEDASKIAATLVHQNLEPSSFEAVSGTTKLSSHVAASPRDKNHSDQDDDHKRLRDMISIAASILKLIASSDWQPLSEP